MKSIRGGKRAGAGRKPTGKVNTETVSFTTTKQVKNDISKEALNLGLTIKEFLLKCVDEYKYNRK